MKNLFLMTLMHCFALSLSAQISFEEKALDLGIDVVYGEGSFGGGIVFYDFDQDGWDDISIASASGDSLYFYKNNQGSFELITPNLVDDTANVKQILWVDFDNDGDKDLFTTGFWEQCRLYENTGDLNMVEITETSGIIISDRPWQGACFGDYDKDGLLDLYIAVYDAALYGYKDKLYKNNGDGTFDDVSEEAGIEVADRAPFGAIFTDFDNDDDADIYVCNDRADGNSAFANNDDGTFDNITESSGAGVECYSMTATPLDFDNDGDEDYYFTNLGVFGSLFVENHGDLTFSEISEENGTHWMHIGWGAVAFDADLDGDQDMFVSGMESDTVNGNDPSIFYENNADGTFSEAAVESFIDDTVVAFSNARGDIDNDGLFDFAVSNGSGYSLSFYENTTATDNHYLKVKCVGTTSNKDAIGTQIRMYIGGEMQYRYTHCGSGYLAQSADYVIFGCSENLTVDSLKVRFLSGIEHTFYDLNTDESYTVTEGESILSVKESQVKNEILVYPNPSEGRIILESPFLSDYDEFELIDANGQVKRKETLSSYGQRLELDLSDEAPGVYIIRLYNDQGSLQKKIIIRD